MMLRVCLFVCLVSTRALSPTALLVPSPHLSSLTLTPFWGQFQNLSVQGLGSSVPNTLRNSPDRGSVSYWRVLVGASQHMLS